MMNLKHLYYYYCFIKDGSTARAAKRLGISAPALSNQLKDLESFIGAPLTRRLEGKIVVTECGDIVLQYAEQMFSTYEELTKKLSRVQELCKDRLRVGVSHNLGTRFTLDLLSLLEKSNPWNSKDVKIIFDSSESIQDLFVEEKFEVILGDFESSFLQNIDCISQRVFFPVRLFISRDLFKDTSARDELLKLDDPSQIIEFANLNQIALVQPTQSVLRTECEDFLASLTVRPQRTMECNRPSAMVQFIERGRAMGFLSIPSFLDFKAAEELTVLGPPQGFWQHEVSFLVNKQKEASLKINSDLSEVFSNGPQTPFI